MGFSTCPLWMTMLAVSLASGLDRSWRLLVLRSRPLSRRRTSPRRSALPGRMYTQARPLEGQVTVDGAKGISLQAVRRRTETTVGGEALRPARSLRWARRLAVGVWLFSWVTIYREIFVWHHMTTTLRFAPPEVPPGVDVQPKAGLPLKAVCVTSVLAPILTLALTLAIRTPARMVPRPGT